VTAEIKTLTGRPLEGGKQQFLDHVARTYDEFVADHDAPPEAFAYCLMNKDGALASWLTTGSLEDHAAAYVSWGANMLAQRCKVTGDGE
jgi:hypothetical protein